MKVAKTTTLGELKEQLAWLWALDDATEVTIGGGHLSVHRAKTILYRHDDKTPSIVNIEFNEIYKVTADPDE